MKPAILLTALLTSSVFTTSAAQAQSQDVCMSTAELEASLKDWYGEAPVEGYADPKQQVWASEASGSWTLVRYLTDGNACVTAQGENWPEVADENPQVAALAE